MFTLIPKRDTAQPQRLWFKPGEPARAFGGDLLFLSGGMLSCVGANGGLRWQHPLTGDYANFYANAGFVIAWSRQQLLILDKGGSILVSERLPENIQFARIGATYAAILVGEGDSQYIMIADHLGNEVERLTDIGNLAMSDLGFFDNQDLRLWTLGIDVNGSEPLNVFSTYDPRSRRSTGTVNLSDQLIYDVFWHNRWLMLAGTNSFTAFNYNCIPASDRSSVIVYGWQLVQSRAVRNDMPALFRRNAQAAEAGMTRAFRLVGSSSDVLLRLPEPCLEGLLGSKGVYAFTNDGVYVCAYGSTSFARHDLPVPLDSVIAMLDNDVAVIASGGEVYMIKLPTPK